MMKLVRRAVIELPRRNNKIQSNRRVSGLWDNISKRKLTRVTVMATSATKPMSRSKTTASNAPAFFIRFLFEQEIALNNIAAGAAWQKLIEKKPDKKNSGNRGKTKSNFFNAKQNWQ